MGGTSTLLDPNQQAQFVSQLPSQLDIPGQDQTQTTAPAAVPSGTEDLEARRGQNVDTTAQLMRGQQQQQQQLQGQVDHQQQQQNDPYNQIAQHLADEYQQLQQQRATGIKGMLRNFVGGMGAAMMHDSGLLSPEQKQGNVLHQLLQVKSAQALDQYRTAEAENLRLVTREMPDGTQIQIPQGRVATFDAAMVRNQKPGDLNDQIGRAVYSAVQQGRDPNQDPTVARLLEIHRGMAADPQISLEKQEANQWLQQNPGKTLVDYQEYKAPLEVRGSNQWLKQNPTKTLTDYQRYKATLVPAFNFNLQNGAGQANLNPRQQATAQAILDGRMSPPGSFALKTPYWQAVMGAVFSEDPQWSEQRAQLRKGYTVGSQSKEINAINTALGHVGVLGEAVDALNNNNVRALNSLGNRLGIQFGTKTGDAVAMYKMIVHRVGPELSKAYIGAGGSAGERGSDEKDFDENLDPSILKGNVGMTARLLRSKIGSLENQWDQNKAPSMPSFQDQFISKEAAQQLNRWSPPTNQPKGSPTGGAFSWDNMPEHK